MRSTFRSLHPRLLGAAVVACLAALAVPATGNAAATSCLVPVSQAAPAAQGPLRFGIYPGGPSGSVNPKAPPRPENPTERLAGLKTLAGSNPFVVRLYSGWTGVTSADDVSGWLDDEVAGYTAAGLQVELVVRYKPATQTTAAPAAFADYVRGIVRRYGPDAGFVSLQVTNEANIPGAPGAADGAFTGAAQAVVKGVIAAKDQVRASGYGQVRIGFSWAYDERPVASTEFWTTLGRLGGSAFANAVDWVGLDTYPGTWTPRISLSNLLPGLAASAVKDSIRSLRDCFMPLAGLGRSTALHIAENGFPTGRGRSEQLQVQTLTAMVKSVDAIRATYGVTDYRWFDLRDSATADPNIESQYGITRDDYSPKPAFATYRDLIGRRMSDGTSTGGPVVRASGTAVAVADRAPTAAASKCRPSRVKVSIPRWRHRRPTSVVVRVRGKIVKRITRKRIARVVRVGGKLVRRVSRKPIPRAVRISMPSGRSAVAFKLTAKPGGRRVTRVQRRSYRVCG